MVTPYFRARSRQRRTSSPRSLPRSCHQRRSASACCRLARRLATGSLGDQGTGGLLGQQLLGLLEAGSGALPAGVARGSRCTACPARSLVRSACGGARRARWRHRTGSSRRRGRTRSRRSAGLAPSSRGSARCCSGGWTRPPPPRAASRRGRAPRGHRPRRPRRRSCRSGSRRASRPASRSMSFRGRTGTESSTTSRPPRLATFGLLLDERRQAGARYGVEGDLGVAAVARRFGEGDVAGAVLAEQLGVGRHRLHVDAPPPALVEGLGHRVVDRVGRADVDVDAVSGCVAALATGRCPRRSARRRRTLPGAWAGSVGSTTSRVAAPPLPPGPGPGWVP